MHWFSHDAWKDLVAGELLSLSPAVETSPQVIFPGAFNPLHHGHTQMAQLATEMLGSPVWFELSIDNVDKSQLEYGEVTRRLTQFAADQIVLTSAATFAEKAKLFPAATFLIGVDTLLRIGDPQYYDDSHEAMLHAIATIAEHNCRFLVFGRSLEEVFHTQHDLTLPTELTAICQAITEPEFRVDVSSTVLREGS
jgi:nicotinic acid mononucleotide adenylyltransferase